MNSKLIQNHDDAVNTHYFVYNKNKKIPIKIDFFKISSNKFAKNQVNINEDKTINLFDDKLEENLNFSDDSIQNFINYVHRQDIFLNNNNVTEINYLAKKYEVFSLISKTEEYINDHHQDLIIPLFTINQSNPSFDIDFYEDIIAKNLEEFVQNESLTNLNISVLYRIIEKYHTQKEIDTNIIDFLFKCLDKQGRKASVLFSFVSIEKLDPIHLNQLLTKYSNVFDFQFINTSLTKTLYEMLNQIILREKQNEEYVKNINNEIDQLKKDLKAMKEMNEKLLNDLKMNKEQNTSEVETIKNDIVKLNKENEKEIDNLKTIIDNMKPQVNSQEQIIQQLQQQMPNLTAKSLISEQNDNRIFSIPHLDYSKMESKTDTNEYFKKLLVWICKNYKDVKFGTWIGAVAPNSRGWMILTIYDTHDVNEKGLPRYCGGCYQPCCTRLYTFNTYEFAFSCKNG